MLFLKQKIQHYLTFLTQSHFFLKALLLDTKQWLVLKQFKRIPIKLFGITNPLKEVAILANTEQKQTDKPISIKHYGAINILAQHLCSKLSK
jgi:hypothetical protein